MSASLHVNRSLTLTQQPPPIPTRRFTPSLTTTISLESLWSLVSSSQTPMILLLWTGTGLVASQLGLSLVLTDNLFKSLRQPLVRLLGIHRHPRPPGTLLDTEILVSKYRHPWRLRNT